MTVEDALQARGLQLPAAPRPLASYVPAVRTGNLVFTSGQLPLQDGKLTASGQVGDAVSLDSAQAAAQLAALNCLAVIKDEIGDLDRIVRVVKLTGYVNSASDFTDQPLVINGASDLLLDLFADRGRHARAAVGVSSLPRGAAVEVEVIVEVSGE